ncbi:hypothetical protein VTK56DRAFT_977 [Thermocarpiscus australiensis]
MKGTGYPTPNLALSAEHATALTLTNRLRAPGSAMSQTGQPCASSEVHLDRYAQKVFGNDLEGFSLQLKSEQIGQSEPA